MALEFDGTTQYIDCGNESSLQIVSDVSVSAWLMVEENWVPADHNYHNIAVKGSIFNLGYGLVVYEKSGISGATYPQFFMRSVSGSAGSGLSFSVPTNWGKNNWVHLLGTFNNTENRLRLYESGGIKVEVSTEYNPGATTDHFYLARPADSYATADKFFKGHLADVRVYNRELTPEEAAEIYHRRGADKVWQGLVGWWKMDEKTSGQTASGAVSVRDLSGNGNHGTPYDGPTYQASPHRLRRGVLVS